MVLGHCQLVLGGRLGSHRALRAAFAQIDKWIETFDADKDGCLNLAEFQGMMKWSPPDTEPE